jgi:hypothetical protein
MSILLGGQTQLLGGERLGSRQQLLQHAAMGGLQPAPLGRAEPLVGQPETTDGIEGVAHTMQLFLEARGQRAEQ